MYKIIFFLTAALLVGCESSLLNPGTRGDNNRATDEIPEVQARDIVLSIGIGESMYFGTSTLSKDIEDASDFYEHNGQSSSDVWGDWLFVFEPMSSGILYKYTLDENNALSGPERLSFGAGSGASHIAVASASKAYVSLGNTGKIAIINPTSMKKTGEIDLTSYAVGTDGSPDPSTSIIRDGLLYVALSQKASVMSAHDTAACVAIINTTNDQVTKLIWDSRAESLGGPDESNATVFTDENNHIYFYSCALWGYQPGLSDGLLRIKNGETEFDPDYYFSIMSTSVSGVPGNSVSYGLTIRYAGNGIVYSSLLVPGLTSNPPDYANDRNYQPVKIDLVNKTITKIPVGAAGGWPAKTILVESSGTVLFGQNESSTPAGLYRYDPVANTVSSSPVLETEGMPYFLYALED